MKLKLNVFLSIILYSSILFGQTNRALVIGISEYKNITELAPVELSKDDAELFYSVLSNQKIASNDNILIFRDERATKFNILLGLITLIEQSNEDDNIIFYFSGYIDVSSLSDSNGYLLCTNVTNEGFYSASDAIRISVLKDIVKIATDKGINMYMYFDIYSSNNLSGGFLGAQKSLVYLREKWFKTSKIISRDSLQFENYYNAGRNSLFVEQIVESIENQGNIIEISTVNADISNNISRISNQEITPIEVVDYSVNNTLLCNTNKKLTPFKFFYNFSTNYTNQIQSFLNNIFTYDSNKIYSPWEKPTLVIDSSSNLLPSGISCMAFSNRDSVIIGKKNGYIQLNTFSGKNITQLNEINLHGRWGIKTIAEYNEDIIFTGAWGYNNIIIYDLKNGIVLNDLRQHSNDVNVLKLSPDKKTLISGGADKKIIIWNIDSSFVVTNSQVFNEYPQDMIQAIEFIDNKSFIAGDKSGNIKFIEIIRGRPIVTQAYNFSSEVVEIKIYNANAYVACKDGNIHVFDIFNKTKLYELNFSGIINDIEISNFPANDNFLFIAFDRQYKIKLVNLEDNTLTYPDIRTKNNVNKLAFISSKKLLALSESSESSVISMQHTEPVSTNFSAYFIYNYIISKNCLSNYNLEKMKFLLVAGMMNYVNNIIYSFIVGKFIYPTIEEVNKSLFFVDYGLSLYSEYEVIEKKLLAQKLILEIYKNILYGTTADLQNSIVLIDSVQKIEPYAVYPLTQLAQVHTELNNLSLAEQNIVLAAQSLPTWTETMARKGTIYQKQGLFDNAEIEYRKIISERPDLSKGYIYLSQLYMQTNNVDSAWKYIKLAQDKEQKNEYILNQRASIAIQSLDIDDARTSLRTAKTLSPTYKISLINEGKYFELNGDLFQAENNYNKLFAADSSIAEPFYLLANLYTKVGDLNKAQELLNIGISRFSDNTEIILALADLNAFKFFNIQADYIWGSKALKLYNQAIDIDPYNYKTYAKKANFYEKLYEHRKKNLIPNNVIISHIDTLSSILFLDTIYSNLKLAANLSPQNLDLLIEFSDYYYKTNNLDSLNKIEKYLRDIENDYQNLFYLGRFYSVTNQNKNAYKNFHKLLKTHPNFDPVFYEMLKLNLNTMDYSIFLNNRDKYQHLKESEYFVYYYETIINLSNNNKTFTKKYSKYYLREIARNNLKYLKRQSPELIVEENWGYSRSDIFENKWIVIKRNNKSGLMLFNGTILIPANFDSILYLNGNLFECKVGSKTFTFKVNLLTASLVK